MPLRSPRRRGRFGLGRMLGEAAEHLADAIYGRCQFAKIPIAADT